jgi:hypothetical protein
LLLIFASVACGSSGSKPGSASGPGVGPSDADADTPDSGADASVPDADTLGPDADASRAEVITPGDDADAHFDGSVCAGSVPDCPGSSCDESVPALCVDGQWTCNGIPATQVGFSGCECFDALTMGLVKCCPSLDGGAGAAPSCAIPDGGQGRIGSGTLICPGGGTPYVADASSCP